MAKSKKKSKPKRRVWLYHVTIGNYLPGSKKICKTMQEALKYIKAAVDQREPWVTDKYVQKSYHITKIAPSQLPEWATIFKEKLVPTPVARPTLSEQGLRKKKRK